MWKFDDNIAPNFVEHARKHIPNYDKVIDKTTSVCNRLCRKDDPIIDVGCATGETLRRLEASNFTNLYGVDNSTSMIKHCDTNSMIYLGNKLPTLISYKVIILNWTLHFIKEKSEYLEHCSKRLQEDGFIILSDKTSKDSFLIDRYHDFKRDCGVSEDEIIGKQQAVEDMMYIDDVNWYFDQGKKLGFDVDIIDADYCFTDFLYRKKTHD